MTRSKVILEMDPPSNYSVDLTPLFNSTSLQCIEPATPCQDVGNTCGNSCEIPSTATCPQLATELLLPLARFLELNPTLDATCNSGGEIKQGTSVCMGGTCGD